MPKNLGQVAENLSVPTKKYVDDTVANKTSISGNAGTATVLETTRTIAISGGATGTATSFNGGSNISIPITSLDASKLSGTASINTTGSSGSCTGNAATATKATQDAAGNIINSTYAPLASPSLTGNPTAPTAATGTNTTQIATTAFVQGAIPDVSEFVTASDDGEISDVVPTTFDGHASGEFVLKTDVIDNLSSDSANTPLSANQGKVLSGLVSTNTTNIASNTSKIFTNTQNIQSNASSIAANTSSIAGKVSKSGDTMTGVLVAQSNTSYTTKQVRNIFLSTSAPTSSDGDNGDIWIVYTP